MYVFIEYTVQYHNQSKEFEKSLKYLNMGFTGMFSVETVLKIIGFGVKVGIIIQTGSTEPTHSFQINCHHSQLTERKSFIVISNRFSFLLL